MQYWLYKAISYHLQQKIGSIRGTPQLHQLSYYGPTLFSTNQRGPQHIKKEKEKVIMGFPCLKPCWRYNLLEIIPLIKKKKEAGDKHFKTSTTQLSQNSIFNITFSKNNHSTLSKALLVSNFIVVYHVFPCFLFLIQ